jgi:hypothetical protein
MRVERRRRDAFLPKQPLQEEEIDAILEEQRRGGVAQHVRRHPAGEAGASREGAQRLAEGLRRPGSRARKQSRVIAVGELCEMLPLARIDDKDAAFAPALTPHIEAAKFVELLRRELKARNGNVRDLERLHEVTSKSSVSLPSLSAVTIESVLAQFSTQQKLIL